MHDLFSADLVTSFLTFAQDTPRPVPEDDEVKAGFVALFLWLGMCVAVALLGWSLMRQFRRTTEAKARGVYGDPVEGEEQDALQDPAQDPAQRREGGLSDH